MLNDGEILSEVVAGCLNAIAGLEVYEVAVNTQRFCPTSWLRSRSPHVRLFHGRSKP